MSKKTIQVPATPPMTRAEKLRDWVERNCRPAEAKPVEAGVSKDAQ